MYSGGIVKPLVMFALFYALSFRLYSVSEVTAKGHRSVYNHSSNSHICYGNRRTEWRT